MKNLLRDVSLIGKVGSGVVALGYVPGVTPIHSLIILVLAVILKDLGDNFYERIRGESLTTLKAQTGPAPLSPLPRKDAPGPQESFRRSVIHPGMAGALIAIALCVTGCGGSNVTPVPEPSPTNVTTNVAPAAPVAAQPTAAQVAANLQTYAYTVANVLQTQNNGTTLQTATLNSALTLAGASPQTVAQAQIVSSLSSLVGNVIIATHNANAPPAVTQSTVNGALTPSAVAATAQAATTTPAASF